jgi:Lar family restriction alleviation protein
VSRPEIMSELKACPFCGGRAAASTSYGDERDGYAERVIVECAGCGVRVGARGDSSKGGYADNSTVKQRAYAAWNRRAPEPKDDKPCSQRLRLEGKAYPRTCMKCGLGPCREIGR